MILPRIKINRLYVLTNEGQIAYDECFHSGVNIIRGDNSSGKSTVLQLLFFALGGAFKKFVAQVKRCRDVYVELYLNETLCTLSRKIECNEKGDVNDRAEMEIYFGVLDDALKKTCPRKVYGFSSTQERASFSNAIFELLGIPELKQDSNITIHQLLRLVYIDQDSPPDSLFFSEPFDTSAKREAVADLLLGSYDVDLYELIQHQKDEQRNLEDIKSTLKGLALILHSSECDSSDVLKKEIDEREVEIASIEKRINDISEGNVEDCSRVDVVKEQKNVVKTAGEDLNKFENDVTELENEIIDTGYFIQELNKKKKSLEDSIKTRKYLDSLTLEYCPICLSKLNNFTEPGHCKLCRSPIEDEKGLHLAKRMSLEIAFQLKEAKKILLDNKNLLRAMQENLSKKKVVYEEEKKRLDAFYKNILPSNSQPISDLFYKKGLLYGEILQYRTLLESVEQYEEMQKNQHVLEDKISKINQMIMKRKSIRDDFVSLISESLRKNGIWFLKNDLTRELDFLDPDCFKINFAENNVTMSSQSRYSASSNFYLKLAARLSIFITSLEQPRMRFPRFIFSDNMEDKGMEIDRAKNIQKKVIERLSKYSVDDYQIIFATSMIAEEFDTPQYVVGEKYTLNNKSLKNV